MGTAVRISDVSKVYQRYSHRKQFRTLKSALLKGNLIQELRPDETFTALSGVTFNIREGATFAVIGRNGSGKSTLLKLMAGITKPTSGIVEVNGRVSALIELGAGFHPEISGRENVFINGIMLGLSKKEIHRLFDEIVEFAELEEFIDAPVKTYSSGMYMRLGFAVAIHVNPDVLLIDEVLAVGDEAFVHKCLDKISEFRRRKKTIVLVTHSLGLVEKMADEAFGWTREKSSFEVIPRRSSMPILPQVTTRDERGPCRRHGKEPERKPRRILPRRTLEDADDGKRSSPCRHSSGRRVVGDRARSRSPTWIFSEKTVRPRHVFADRRAGDHSPQSQDDGHDFATSSSELRSSTPTVFAATAPTPISRSLRPRSSPARVRYGWCSSACSSSRGPTSWTWRPTNGMDTPLTTIELVVHLSGRTRDQRPRDLPAHTPLGVHAQYRDPAAQSS